MKNKTKLFTFLFLLIPLLTNAGEVIKVNQKFLNALGKVESNNNDLAIGDNGKAISRFQIWRVCYQDAREYNKTINFSYESLTNKVNAEIIVNSYLSRYCKESIKNNDFEKMARIWNGGPSGYKKQSTIKYWDKIKNNLTY
jgi:hypothetical protein